MSEQMSSTPTEEGPKPGRTVICLCLDMIGSTKKTINFSTNKLDCFNRALIQQIEPHLKQLEMEKELLKFTGDGWLLLSPNSSLIPRFCCLAIIQKHRFQIEMASKTLMSKQQIPPLRIALAIGRDIAVKLPEGRKDEVGDSARRAVRAAQHCFPNEILIAQALVQSGSLNRDFEIIEADVENRKGFANHKKEETLMLNTLVGIKHASAADLHTVAEFAYTLQAIGQSEEAKTAVKKGRDQILKIVSKKPEDSEKMLASWNRLVTTIHEASFVSQMIKERRSTQWYDQLRLKGIEPDVVTYNTLVSKAEDYSTAKDWYEKMRQEGIEPNVMTTATLFSKNLSTVPVEELLTWYWSLGFRSGEPLQAAIASYRKANRLDCALRIALHYPYLNASKRLFRNFIAQAHEYLNRVLREEPNHPDVQYALGLAYLEWGDNTNAERHLLAAFKTATQEKRKRDIVGRINDLKV